MPTLIRPGSRAQPVTGPGHREYRTIHHVEVRAVNDTLGEVELLALRYKVEDDYGTLFRPGAFTKELEQRLPQFCNNHDWSDVLGRAIDFTDSPTDLRFLVRMTDMSIPECRRAYLELKNGVIDECSIGFERFADREEKGVGTWIEEGRIYEVSKVLLGAVPGTQILDVRSAAGRESRERIHVRTGAAGTVLTVDAEDVARILTRFAAGELDLHEALGEVKAQAVATPPAGDDPDLAVLAALTDDERAQVDELAKADPEVVAQLVALTAAGDGAEGGTGGEGGEGGAGDGDPAGEGSGDPAAGTVDDAFLDDAAEALDVLKAL